MSQEIYLCSDETELWSGGGRIYRSLESARKYVPRTWEKDEDGHLVRGPQEPIYKLDITWTLVDD